MSERWIDAANECGEYLASAGRAQLEVMQLTGCPLTLGAVHRVHAILSDMPVQITMTVELLHVHNVHFADDSRRVIV